MLTELERFRDTFFLDAAEHLAEMEAGLRKLAVDGENPRLLNTVLRSARAIRGAAGTFGLTGIIEFSRPVENLLEAMQAGEGETGKAHLGLLMEATRVLWAMVEAVRLGAPEPAAAVPLRLRLHAALPLKSQSSHRDSKDTVRVRELGPLDIVLSELALRPA